MLLSAIWQSPEKIDDFCAILARLCDIRETAISRLIMESSQQYLLKYSNELIELVMAVIDGKITSNSISLNDAFKTSNDIPSTIIGKVCQTLVKAFKVTIALKYNEKRVSSSVLLVESLYQYLYLVIAIINGGEINYNMVYDRLDEIELKLKELTKTNA